MARARSGDDHARPPAARLGGWVVRCIPLPPEVYLLEGSSTSSVEAELISDLRRDVGQKDVGRSWLLRKMLTGDRDRAYRPFCAITN
jgi:hypothetical protein